MADSPGDPSANEHPPRALGAEEVRRDDRRARILVWLVAAIATLMVAAALRIAGAVIVPVVAAVFIALAVAPVANAVKRHVPRRFDRLGEAAAMGVVLLVLGAFFAGIFLSAQQVVTRFTELYQDLSDFLPAAPVGDPGAATGDAGGGAAEKRETAEAPTEAPTAEPAADPGAADREAAEAPSADGRDPLSAEVLRAAEADAGTRLEALWTQVEEAIGRSGGDLASYATGFATAILNSVGAVIAALTLIFFLVLLMLIEATRWQAKIEGLMPEDSRAGWRSSIRVAAASFRWYLLVRTVLGAITATLYVLWLAVFGVDLLIVWWVLTFLLSYIPAIGSVISGIIPVVYVLVTRDFATTLFVAGGLLVFEQVMGNYVDPRMLGKQLALSPLVTFTSLVFWGWMWGVAGALLAVPLTVLFVIAGAHFRALRPMALLLSDETSLEALRERTAG